jgi:hypothetical protein
MVWRGNDDAAEYTPQGMGEATSVHPVSRLPELIRTLPGVVPSAA